MSALLTKPLAELCGCSVSELLGTDLETENGEVQYRSKWLMLLMGSGTYVSGYYFGTSQTHVAAIYRYLVTSIYALSLSTNQVAASEYYGVGDVRLNHVLAWFVFVNAAATIVEPAVERLGLRPFFLVVCSLLCLGGIMCCGVFASESGWQQVKYGMWIIGFAQGLCQCPMANLAGRWFGPNGRTQATAMALTMNNLGFGIAYIVPGLHFKGVDGQPKFHYLMLGVSLFLTLSVVLFFEEMPPIAPSASARQSRKAEKSTESTFSFVLRYWYSVLKLFFADGFLAIVLIASGVVSISYLVTSYLDTVMEIDFNIDSRTDVSQPIVAQYVRDF